MKAMVENLVAIVGTDEAAQKGEALLKEIDDVIEFHKVDFPCHLESEESQDSCVCLRCGFYNKTKDPIVCKK